MGDHRWRGYTHEELYAQIHAGPGAAASASSVVRWSELTRALGEIDSDLTAALERCGGSWEGAAADAARAGLTPLGEWACDARGGAEVMRLSAELQADYVSKARADMPQPVAVTAEEPSAVVSGLVHLFGGQTDYERQEAAADAAEQRAFEVMVTYESSTRSNTSTLGEFSPPPQVVVATPFATVAVGAGVAGLLRRAPRPSGPVVGGTAAARQPSTPAPRPASTPQRGATPPPRPAPPAPGTPAVSASANASTGAPSTPAGTASGQRAPAPPPPGPHQPTVPGPRPAPPVGGLPALARPPAPPHPVPAVPTVPPPAGGTGRSTVDRPGGRPRPGQQDGPTSGGRSSWEESTTDGPRDHRGLVAGPFADAGAGRQHQPSAPAPVVGPGVLPASGVIGAEHLIAAPGTPPVVQASPAPHRVDEAGHDRTNYLLPADDVFGDPTRPTAFGAGRRVVPPVIGEGDAP
ncbi:PPE domain-containing protein [Streptoalloteichus hindustanus]|uniref:PPE family protein n=1 Tax=Streptoalloteichus hindustanus TaxID=2017 RepID=A0A1M5K7V6_STRHI|nr:PPE domain-containing protein [Streptoalloteichus hindustanus]SHG48886.1 PPE family protein [Streptoalloteichus hindustanus]